MAHQMLWRLIAAWLLSGGFMAAQPALARQPCPDVEVAAGYAERAIDPGVDDLGLHCDDCTAQVDFPFPVRLYGVDYTSAMVSSNGNVQFAGDSTQYQDECLPTTNMDTTVFVLWDDLVLTEPDDGVFTSTTGDAPTRVFNIEWRAHYYGQGGSANFEVRFFENSRNFELVYGTYTGQTYTIGVQKGRGELDRYIRCNFANPFAPGTVFVFTETYTSSRSQYTGSAPYGVTDIGNHCDDCVTPITFPFPITFYGETYTSGNVSSNGNLQFASDNPEYANDCLPVPGFGPTIFAHWDDLRTDGVNDGTGVFTNVSGTAPFRIFDIEWITHYYNGAGSAAFTLRFLEGLDYYKLYFPTSDQHGASATLGTQAGDERYQVQWCNTLNSANPGDVYTFSLPPMRVVSEGGNVPPCTDDTGNHCDDCTTPITLPFTVNLFGEEYTTAIISSNGNIQFGSNDRVWINTCLPVGALGTTIFGYWDDLSTSAPGRGVYTRIFGTAPNRQLGIEWRAVYFNTLLPANFEVILYESIPRCDVYFGALPFGGASGTVGVQHGGGPEFLQYSCDAAGRLPVWVQFLCIGAPPPPPCDLAITGQPQDATACPAGSAVFTVTGAGTDPVFYQWRCVTPSGDPCGDLSDGTYTDPDTGLTYDVAGASTPSLTISNIILGSHPNTLTFAARLTNACSDLSSDIATLTIADPPTITAQPGSLTVCPGGSATFIVAGAGTEPVSYQWQCLTPEGAPCGDLSEGPFTDPDTGLIYDVAGAATPSLTISNIFLGGHSRILAFGARVDNDCGSVSSDAATLTVCPADFNCDGSANSQDFFDFLNAFFASAPSADFNADGTVNSQDFFDFLNAFFAGCP